MSFSLNGYKIVVSRNPLNLSRFDTTSHLSQRGAQVRDRVDSLTTFVLTTVAEAAKATPTSKVAAAQKAGVPVVNDAEWRQLQSEADLRRLLSSKRPAPASASQPAQPAAMPDPPPRPAISLDFDPVQSPFTTCL